MGYHRAGFEVIGVDINPQSHYPFEFHQADAMIFSLDGYDAFHASPPCQAYCKETNPKYRKNHPNLIKPFIIENVEGARFELQRTIKLCGSMFGLHL